jgi:protein-disulfide isomerase
MEHHNHEEHRETHEATEQKQSSSFMLPASILVAGVLIAGSVIYSAGRKAPAQNPNLGNNQQAAAAAPTANLTEALKIGNRDVILGDANAPVTLVEYGDYQCPFCGRMFSQVEPQLRDEYIKTGKLKMVYRNFQFLGEESTNAGAAAECAKDQSKFWAFHDELYKAEIADGKENSGNLVRSLFVSLAGKAGLDVNAFTSCYDSGKYVEQVKKDTAAAQAIGVNSTPTNYINGQMVQGAQPYSAFKSVIDIALQKK